MIKKVSSKSTNHFTTTKDFCKSIYKKNKKREVDLRGDFTAKSKAYLILPVLQFMLNHISKILFEYIALVIILFYLWDITKNVDLLPKF